MFWFWRLSTASLSLHRVRQCAVKKTLTTANRNSKISVCKFVIAKPSAVKGVWLTARVTIIYIHPRHVSRCSQLEISKYPRQHVYAEANCYSSSDCDANAMINKFLRDIEIHWRTRSTSTHHPSSLAMYLPLFVHPARSTSNCLS